MLWQEAMTGAQATRDDVMDLIEEVKFLRDTCDLPCPDLPKATIPATVASSSCDPWANEWPGNP